MEGKSAPTDHVLLGSSEEGTEWRRRSDAERSEQEEEEDGDGLTGIG